MKLPSRNTFLGYRAARGNRVALVVAIAIGVAGFVAVANAATRRTVCATNVYVRSTPVGIVIGTLYKGQSINVERYTPHDWAYGFAYGGANKYGWVPRGALCP